MAVDVPKLFRELMARATEPQAPASGLRGLPSVCSSNKFVIAGSMKTALRYNAPLLVECTSNQVNQDGGYTGMRPSDFREFVGETAKEYGIPSDRIIIGADHFGPNPWQSEPATEAMEKARELVRLASAAGFAKIHLDASMPLGGETYGTDFGDQTIAERQAELASIAETSWVAPAAADDRSDGPSGRLAGKGSGPVYVVGSEVPIPGGTQEAEELQVTQAADFTATVAAAEAAFARRGLTEAWSRVVAVVVQPGVEFGSFSVDPYDPSSAEALVRARRQGSLLFEGHSTDYQTEKALSQLVDDGVGILKVGPALSFAVREALFLLEHIEQALAERGAVETLSHLTATLDGAMCENPKNWESHYHGTPTELAFARRYSLSDRCRYYWDEPSVANAVVTLLNNLKSAGIPPVLASQYFPAEVEDLGAFSYHETSGGAGPVDLILARVDRFLSPYFRSCGATVIE